jgi:cobalt-zinc-cadmium efflux system membrane fusion protein
MILAPMTGSLGLSSNLSKETQTVQRISGTWLAALVVLASWPCGAEIPVTAEQRTALGIEVAEARAVSEAPLAALPAQVTLPGDSTQAVVVPLSGTVERVLAQDGQRVRTGQPLMQLRSRDFLDVQGFVSAADARIVALNAQVERDRLLVAEGIVPSRRLEESQADLGAARAERESRAGLLRTIKPVAGTAGAYQLLAPMDGLLVESGLATGDHAEPEMVAFFILAGQDVWVLAQLPERLLGQVSPGFRVEAGDPPSSGRVLSVGLTLDPQTRSAQLRAALPAGPGLRPGQATELRVFAPVAAGTVVVPASALTRIGGEEHVFRASENGFVAVPVKSGLRTADGVALLGEGLSGSHIAVSGVSALKVLAQED